MKENHSLWEPKPLLDDFTETLTACGRYRTQLRSSLVKTEDVFQAVHVRHQKWLDMIGSVTPDPRQQKDWTYASMLNNPGSLLEVIERGPVAQSV